jgi:ABC-2 type transport system permease protein
MNAAAMAISDGMTIARRNVTKLRRGPDLIAFVVMTPVIFVLLFAYVFGSAVNMPGMSYREFLLPGIFVQTMVYGASLTAAAWWMT